MIDILTRITEYREARGWTEYKLAEMSGLPQSTISSWFRKNMLPSLTSLEKICDAFQISLSQFFSDSNKTYALCPEEEQLLKRWQKLSSAQRQAILKLIDLM